MKQPLANDNKAHKWAGVDPDLEYVRDYMAKACAHFKDRGIDRKVIGNVMMTELFKMLDANPFRSPGDEGAIRGDQSFLWYLKHRVLPMSETWDAQWIRVQYEKRPTFKFNRAAPRPAAPLPPRLQMPIPGGEGSLNFLSCMRRLRLRPGHVYSDKEIQTRFNRRQAAILSSDNASRFDRAKRLYDAKHGIMEFFRKHRAGAKARISD